MLPSPPPPAPTKPVRTFGKSATKEIFSVCFRFIRTRRYLFHLSGPCVTSPGNRFDNCCLRQLSEASDLVSLCVSCAGQGALEVLIAAAAEAGVAISSMEASSMVFDDVSIRVPAECVRAVALADALGGSADPLTTVESLVRCSLNL